VNIVVCLKQVPGTTEVQIDPETNTLRRQGIENVVNPFDAYALEEGVSLRERFGGKVTAISMGPPQAEEMLREAISCGADEAVLVSDRAFAGADTLATSYTLSRAIHRLGEWDLVICGRQTIDGDTGQVGPELAEWLDAPFVAYVSKVEDVGDGAITVRRMVEDGHEVIEMPLPGIITVVKEINVPRLPSLRGTMKAKRAEIPAWTVADLDVDEALIGLSGSPTTVVKVFFPRRVHDAEMIEGDPAAQVASLVEKLRGAGIG
jgi:electron transfer flavoprotein beta subunit